VGTQFDEIAVFKGECETCAVFALYPGIHLTGEEKSWKTISQGSREVPSWRAFGRTICVDLPTILLGTSSGLLTSVACASGDLAKTSAIVNICCVPEIRDPHTI